MSVARAARRRAEREAAKSPQRNDGPIIKLVNPQSNNFESFIVGNAATCRRIPPHTAEEIRAQSCTNDCTPIVEGDSAKGQHLILCGAGPSLRDNLEWLSKGDQIWGCNSAATWLHSEGHPITHGFTVDQTAQMCEEWYTAPDIEYLLASTVHPHLLSYLLSKGRKTRIFHNFVGLDKPPVDVGNGMVMDYEMWLYHQLYLPTAITGWGLNSVTRAIGLALVMGFEKVSVLGADCALRFKSPPPDAELGSEAHTAWLTNETVMHADGGHALASGATPVVMPGVIDGRLWLTKPDMAETARWLVEIARKFRGRVELIGDTLPNAMMNKDDEFLDRLPRLTDGEGRPVKILI